MKISHALAICTLPVAALGARQAQAALIFSPSGLGVDEIAETTFGGAPVMNHYSNSSVTGIAPTINQFNTSSTGDIAAASVGPTSYSLSASSVTISAGASASSTLGAGSYVAAIGDSAVQTSFTVDVVTDLTVNYTTSIINVGGPLESATSLVFSDSASTFKLILTAPGTYSETYTLVPGDTYFLAAEINATSVGSAFAAAGFSLSMIATPDSGAVTPEPASLGILALGGIALLRRRSV